jgi:hypothetical protein
MGTEIRITKSALKKALARDLEAILDKTVDAFNSAPAGGKIAGSEEAVRRAAAEFRQRLYEKAVQLGTQAAEAAFSPSGESEGGGVEVQGDGGDRSSDEQRSDSDRA